MFSGQDPEPQPQTPRLYNSTKLAHGTSLICCHFLGGIRQGVEADCSQNRQMDILNFCADARDRG